MGLYPAPLWVKEVPGKWQMPRFSHQKTALMELLSVPGVGGGDGVEKLQFQNSLIIVQALKPHM